jgi:hypothetical protein
MARTAREALQLIEQTLDDAPPSAFADEVRAAIEDGLTDLEERPQPEPVGTAREAFGGILDVATGLVAHRLTVGHLDSARDRLLQLVEIGLADIHARPQQGPRPVVLEAWQIEKSVELALRWYEVEPNGAGSAGLLGRVDQVQRIMRGEPAIGTGPAAVSKGKLDELTESWLAAADGLPHNTVNDATELAYRTCARQLRKLISGG